MGEGAGADLDILLAEDNPGDIRLVKEALDEPARTTMSRETEKKR